MTEGMKFDDGKLDWTLLPVRPMEGVLRVLQHGAKKYERDNWQLVEDAERRYQSALIRHMMAILRGEEHDEESGLPHIDHVATNALFLSHFQQQKDSDEATDLEVLKDYM